MTDLTNLSRNQLISLEASLEDALEVLELALSGLIADRAAIRANLRLVVAALDNLRRPTSTDWKVAP